MTSRKIAVSVILMILGLAQPAAATRFYKFSTTGKIENSPTVVGSFLNGQNLDGQTATFIMVVDTVGGTVDLDASVMPVYATGPSYGFFGVGGHYLQLAPGPSVNEVPPLGGISLFRSGPCSGTLCESVAGSFNLNNVYPTVQFSGGIEGEAFYFPNYIRSLNEGLLCTEQTLHARCGAVATILYGRHDGNGIDLMATIRSTNVSFGPLQLSDLAPGLIIPGFNDLSVPEPESWLLMITGFILVGGVRRRAAAKAPSA